MTNSKYTKQEEIQATESIIVARISMMMNHPFIGNLATRLVLKATDEISTAATDGRSILFYPQFVNKLKRKEVEFLVGHEILHVIMSHAGEDSRLSGRDPKVWNCAADFVVNLILVEQKIGELITTVPVLYDKKYTNWSTEQVYDDLMQESDADKASKAKKVLDQHLEDSADDGPEGTKMSPEERKAIQDDMREAMISASQSSDPGSIPAGIKRMIGEFTEPKMDWRQLLQQQIESQLKSDFTYSRPSRKGWGMDAILPALQKEPTIECTVAIDTSGSISTKQIRDFLSEINGMMAQHTTFKIGVCTWDTRCYNYQEFDENNAYELETYQIHGGGGTNIECVFEMLKDNDIVPKQLVVFTDMELFGGWGDENYCDTIWLANDSNAVAPYGTTIKF